MDANKKTALLAGLNGQARLVGYALSALDDRSRIPWHRVVNARGYISARRDGSPAALCRASAWVDRRR